MTVRSSTARIAVIGVGTVGSQVLWQLASRGITAVGFEQFAPGHARGSAGGETRLLSHVEITDPRYMSIIQGARARWVELTQRTGQPLFTETGALLMGDPATPDMAAALSALSVGDVPHEEVTRSEFSARYRQLRLGATDVALMDSTAGVIRPELSVHSVSRLAAAAGAQIHTDTPAIRIDRAAPAGGVAITTASGTEFFDRVVVTAGVWTQRLLPTLTAQLTMRRPASSWHLPVAGVDLRGMLPFMRISPDYIYGIPTFDQQSLKLGLGFDHHLPMDDADEPAPPIDSGDLVRFRELIEAYLPGIARVPVRAERYVETYTASRRELVGWHPTMPDVLVLAGFSGHGFKVAPVLAEIAADMVSGATPQFDTTHFTQPTKAE